MKKIVLVLLLFSLSLGVSFIQDKSYAVDLTLPESLGYSARHTATNVTDVFEFVKDGEFLVLSLKETPSVLSGKLSLEFDAGSLVGWYANGSSTLITTSTESQPAHLLTYLDLSGAYVDTGEYKITMNAEVTYTAAEQEIHDNGEQDIRFVFRSTPGYLDLFYEDIEISFTVDTDTNYVTPGTFEFLFQYKESFNPTTTNFIKIYINDVIISEFDFDTGNYQDMDYSSNPEGDTFMMKYSIDGESLVFTVLGEDNSFGFGDYEFSDGDNIRLSFKALKPFTKYYSYGKIRTQSSNDYFYKYNEQTKKVYLQTSSGSTTFNPALIQANEVITLQSPYKNFKVSYGTVGNPVQYLVNVSDVSVVQMHKLGTSSLFNFYVYHWVDGQIELSTFLNINLSNRNSLNVDFSGGIRQALSGNAIIIGNVDDANDIYYYLGFLKAYDDIDGDISDSIYVIDDGDYLGSVVGTYTITAGVTDSESQETTFTFAAVVADNVAPTLVAPNLNQTIAYTATFNFTTYLAALVKTDNYYDSEDINITIQSNAYTPNKAIPGIYDVVLRVIDPYNNFTDYTLKITVTDPVAPTFTSGLTTLSKSINEHITLAQILATQVATDTIDGNVSSSITVISDNYTGNETTPGDYTIVIEASDLSGNKIQKTITINVFSGVPGWYLPDDGPIIIPNGSQLTFEQIKAVLVSVGWIAPDIEVTFLSSTYFGNEDKPGTYKLNLSLDGVPTEFDLLVLNQGDNWFPDVPNPPLVAQPNITLIIASVVAAVAVVGTVLFIIIKKRKA